MTAPWTPVIPGLLFHLADAGYHASVYFLMTDDGACLIDPSVSPAELPAEWKPQQLLLTHAHADHAWGVDRFREAAALPLFIHTDDAAALADPHLNGARLFGQHFSPAPASDTFTDGQTLAVGNRLTLGVIHTPGHTQGSCCFLLRDDRAPLALITGDTLFPGSIGRSDLAGGDPAALQQSLIRLRGVLETLPPDLPLLAGHGPVTSAGRELAYNPFLQLP